MDKFLGKKVKVICATTTLAAGSKEEAIKKIDEKVKVLNCVECGTYSKEISRYCIDFRFV